MFQPFIDFMETHGGQFIFTALLCAPLVFIIFDVLTGIVRAWRDGEISSSIGRDGAGHKFAIVMAIIAVFLVEGFLFIVFGIHLPLLIPTVIYIICNESISIIENLCLLNPQLAPVFAPILKILRNSQDEKVKELESITEVDKVMEGTKED